MECLHGIEMQPALKCSCLPVFHLLLAKNDTHWSQEYNWFEAWTSSKKWIIVYTAGVCCFLTFFSVFNIIKYLRFRNLFLIHFNCFLAYCLVAHFKFSIPEKSLCVIISDYQYHWEIANRSYSGLLQYYDSLSYQKLYAGIRRCRYHDKQYPTGTGRWTIVGLMLAHRLRCWLSIKPA